MRRFDVIEFLDEHSIKQAHLLGHSMGGKVAMQIALNFPQRVDKLIIADIAPVTYSRLHTGIPDGLQALAATQLSARKQADELLAQYVNEAAVRSFLLKNLHRTEAGTYKLRLNLPAIIKHYQALADAPV